MAWSLFLLLLWVVAGQTQGVCVVRDIVRTPSHLVVVYRAPGCYNEWRQEIEDGEQTVPPIDRFTLELAPPGAAVKCHARDCARRPVLVLVEP